MRILFAIIALIVAALIVIGISTLLEKLELFSHMGCLGVIIKIALVIDIFVAVYSCSQTFLSDYDYTDAYLTTKTSLDYYEKIEKEPYGKESGVLMPDSVIKAINIKKKQNIAWIEGYIILNNKAKHLYFLIPSKDIAIKQNCEYFDFNAKSRSFSAYYEKIDNENATTRKQIKNEFINELSGNNIIVEHSSDSVLRKSIKKTAYIFPNSGFLDAFVSNDSDFYYIDKGQKKNFYKIFKFYQKELDSKLKPYFE